MPARASKLRASFNDVGIASQPVQIELREPARSSLPARLERRGGSVDNFAFPSRIDRTDQLRLRQYARLVGQWVSGIGLRREDYGMHSLRRTKGRVKRWAIVSCFELSSPASDHLVPASSSGIACQGFVGASRPASLVSQGGCAFGPLVALVSGGPCP